MISTKHFKNMFNVYLDCSLRDFRHECMLAINKGGGEGLSKWGEVTRRGVSDKASVVEYDQHGKVPGFFCSCHSSISN